MSTIKFILGLSFTILILFLCHMGKAMLVPLVIAIFLWYLINAVAKGYRKLIACEKTSLILAVVTFIGIVGLGGKLISLNIPALLEAAPQYQKNIETMLDKVLVQFNLEKASIISQITENIHIGKVASYTASGIADLTGSTIMIMIYLIFLLLEQGNFSQKISMLASSKQGEKKIRHVINSTYSRIEQYLWVKTFTSLITALLSYAVMAMVGLDFAEFWAVLIFLLNYIPNIGSIIATLFPALLALVQFDTLVPFAIVSGGIIGLQFLIGNVVEPRMMGKSLNLSPLIILISLVLWGNIWGIAGMFLCVPITVIAMITLSEFPRTRPIAVLLSGDGRIKNVGAGS